ncbi:hypothetical protein [Mesorhizobium denitrificans]|nr:hypothetical protein [Mesorhizobium denitrificans]
MQETSIGLFPYGIYAAYYLRLHEGTTMGIRDEVLAAELDRLSS